MSFSDKLSRLGTKAPLSEREVSEAQDPLAALRAKMDALLGAPLGEMGPLPAPMRRTETPFLEEECDAGIASVWRRVLPPSHHVGRIPVDAAKVANMDILALLALDPSLRGLDAERALFLDTETTGLGGSGVLAFLVGLAWFDGDGGLVLEQFFLQEPGEEPALLELLRRRIEAASFLVTFNGKSFDLPLLRGRAVMNHAPEFAVRPHLDLLHIGRRLHRTRLGKCRLTELEDEVLGWIRSEADISGADIAPLYGHFLRTLDYEIIRPVVDHNAWDVLSMAALVGLYGEPVGLLHPEDLAAAGDIAQKAKDYKRAETFIEAAISGGADERGLLSRARLFKARGDKERALLDYERICQETRDPKLRLELTKLYEHHKKDFASALRYLDEGTGEGEEKEAHRRARLLQKLERTGSKTES